LASNFAIFEESWVLLHAPKLGHGTDGFTSHPKEGMLWIFPAGKAINITWSPVGKNILQAIKEKGS
jgi:hypothetical protein